LDFFHFRTMVAPSLIKLVYAFGTGFLLLAGFAGFLASLVMIFTGHAVGGFGALLGALLGVIVGLLACRIICEFAIVVFRIHEELVERGADG
jgi:Domain of unknown function (DUF4282)